MALRYFDNFYVIWRRGTPDDPYIAKTDSNKKIIGNRFLLGEIPDSFTKVTITNYIETTSTPTAANQFQVDYNNGIVTFFSSEEGKTIPTVTYLRSWNYPNFCSKSFVAKIR